MPSPTLCLAILAGGSGTRFWPAGRTSRPKQLLALDGDDPRSLAELTVERLRPLATRPPWVIAPRPLLPPLRRVLGDLPSEAFVAEPRPRNTAAAVVLAAHLAGRTAPGSTVLAVPADHHVRGLGRYRRALRGMVSRARRAGTILTLGLEPDRPATGYGYLELGRAVEPKGRSGVREVVRYVEKPGLARARRLVAGGRHLWNGGTFAFRPDVLLAEAERHLPDVAGPLAAAFETFGSRGFSRALARAYAAIPSISVDYGIMERTDRVEVVPSDVEWDDLGSWDAVARHRRADARGNRARGDVTLVDARDCVVDAEEGHVALLGVRDLVVVQSGRSVLVARRGRGERVREVVERLRAAGREDLIR